MTILLDLLFPYPIVEDLASSLALGDLFSLSKVNSAYRAALHGFENAVSHEDITKRNVTLRPSLLIGAHRTRFWENLKARTRLQCSEPQHKRGSNAKGCLICSMPVCEACIIKASFAKRKDTTFQNRHRPLCSDCWYTGNPHRKHPVGPINTKVLEPYPDQAAKGDICICAAKDGILCLQCRTDQNDRVENEVGKCYGQNCPQGNAVSKSTEMYGRVCLWCSRQLPESRSRAESRRDYDARHLFARSHSSYDRPPEEKEDLDTFEEQRMLELDALSRKKQETRDGVTPSSLHVAGSEEDRFDRQARVDFLARTREEERWQQSEAARYQEWSMLPPPRRDSSGLPRYEDHDRDHIAGRNDEDLAVTASRHTMTAAED